VKKRSDRDFFMEIWNERPHESEVSGEYLGEEPLAHFFSHVCAKGTHPTIRYEKRNIMLMTIKEHHTWDFGSRVGEMWDKVRERQEEMQQLSAKLGKK
jgi:hypothetical protein